MTTTAAVAAVRSMTGYAEGRQEADGWLVRVTIRSVNHRFLDVRVRLPEGLESFEPLIRQMLRDRVRRGHVEVGLRVEPVAGTTVQINRDLVTAYMRVVEGLRQDFNLKQEIDLAALLRLPGVLGAASGDGETKSVGDDTSRRLKEDVRACLEHALTNLDQMRGVEGKALAEEMSRLLAGLKARTAEVQVLVEASRPAYAARLKARLEELLNGASFEPTRLAQEAALIAERADVSEELARLVGHIEQFSGLIDGAGEIGKKLDFLLQEMQREANTLLSKTPGLGPDGLAITDAGLRMKSEIEKLKEQVQNVE
jgi:uncharacterized protein (TIGR00255 family)